MDNNKTNSSTGSAEPQALEDTNSYTNYLSPSPVVEKPTPSAPPTAPPPVGASTEAPSKKSYRLPVILASLLTLVSLASIVFAVFQIIEYKRLEKDHESLKTKIADKTAIVNRMAEVTKKEISSPEDVPDYDVDKSYIYFNEWDLKLKIPNSLARLSYIFHSDAQKICFTAVKMGITSYPEFAKLSKNPDGIACLRRIPVASGTKENGKNIGDIIFVQKDYNIFYVAPEKVFSKEIAEKKMENDATAELKSILKKNLRNY